MNRYVSPIIEIADIDVEDIMTVSQEEPEEPGTESGSGNTTQNPNEGPMMPFSIYFD